MKARWMMLGADSPRVLVLSASYGAGHNQAARAIQKAILTEAPSSEVRIVDFFQFVSEPLNRLTQTFYVQSVRHMPLGYGMFYKKTSAIASDSWVQRQLNGLGRQRLDDYLKTWRPQAIICTFPTPAGVLSELRLDSAFDIPVYVVITDFTIHSQWLHPNIERFFVAADEVAEGLRVRGVDQDRITVSGIPVGSEFSRRLDKDKAIEKLGLRSDLPLVMVMAGAFNMLNGVGDAVKILADLDIPHQSVVVAGQDERLAARLGALAGSARHPLTVLGFVDDIHTMMCAADLLVTKAGGITVSEALACALPMIIYRAIPGQEESNTAYLSRHNAAVPVRNTEELESAVRRLLSDEPGLAAMRASAHRLARPRAAQVIANNVLGSRKWSQTSQPRQDKVLV